MSLHRNPFWPSRRVLLAGLGVSALVRPAAGQTAQSQQQLRLRDTKLQLGAPEPQTEPDVPAGLVTSSIRRPRPPEGLVASGLRPWIELELQPSQAFVTDEQAAITFDVTLYNSGSAPARDIAVEVRLINAGDEQDQQLSSFYTAPSEAKDKIPSVAPLVTRTSFSGSSFCL